METETVHPVSGASGVSRYVDKMLEPILNGSFLWETTVWGTARRTLCAPVKTVVAAMVTAIATATTDATTILCRFTFIPRSLRPAPHVELRRFFITDGFLSKLRCRLPPDPYRFGRIR